MNINEKLDLQLIKEKEAINLYNSFIKKINDPEIKKKISLIRDDEIKHVNLVKEMISIIKEYKGKVKISKVKEKGINLNGFIDKFSSLFVMPNINEYPSTVINIIKKLKMDCIYVSFNKVPNHTKKLLMEHNIDIKKIKFISCVKIPSKDLTVDPESLTDISIVLEKLMSEMKGKFFVLVDKISGLSLYHNPNIILKFISLINAKLDGYGSGIVWIGINDRSEKELNNKISHLCDKVIKI